MKLLMVLILFLGGGCVRPMTHHGDARCRHAEEDMAAIEVSACIPDHPLTLDDVVEIALLQNMDLLVKEQERAIQYETAAGAKLKMIPNLDATGNLSQRSNKPDEIGSAPSSVKTGRQWTLEGAWNVLNFGLTYLRATQEANKELVADQIVCRIRQNLVLEVTTTYWKAVLADQTTAETEKPLVAIRELRGALQKQRGKRNLSEIQGLRLEDQALDAEMQLEALRADAHGAKVQLVALMGLPAGTEFTLAPPPVSLEPLQEKSFDVRALEDQALSHRPELFQKDIEGEIMADEVRASILQLFPNVALFQQYSGDGNPFLIHTNWLTMGARASWSLFSLPAQLRAINESKDRKELVRTNRIALSIGVLTQVNIAVLNYKDSMVRYNLASDSFGVKMKLYGAAKKENQYGELHGLDLLYFEVQVVLSRINALKAYVSLQIAEEQINNSVGGLAG